MLSEKFLLSGNTVILCMRLIAHLNLLGCAPVCAHAIAHISGNSIWIFGK